MTQSTSMSAHTPGPWTLDAVADGWMLIANGQDITAEAFDTSEANARLIAAAPEMLDVLKQIADCGDSAEGRPAYHYMRAIARAILAKAEGRVV